MLPSGYGMAYPELFRMTYVCYPFPLNHFIRIIRNLWLRIKNAEIKNIEKDIISDIQKEKVELLKIKLHIEKNISDYDEYRKLLFEALRR